jgi:hypothetical protein
MNPQTWPQWLKVAIGLVLLAGNAWLPWLEGQALSPGLHTAITTVAGMWLFVVNTWNASSGQPPIAKPPPLPLLLLAFCLTGCAWLKSDSGQVVSKTVVDAACIIATYESGVTDQAALAQFCETSLDFVIQTLAAKKQGEKRAATRKP